MCGLSGWFCFGDARPEQHEIRRLWMAQLPRGTNACGSAFLRHDKWTISKSSAKLDEYLETLTRDQWRDLLASPIALLHTRATTKGSEKNYQNNHPVSAYGWVLTHNGTLRNDDKLFKFFADQEKVERIGQVDTAAINLVLSRGKTFPEALGGIGTLTGTATFVAAHSGVRDAIMLGRWEGKPLALLWDHARQIFFWSSEESGLSAGFRIAGITFHTTAWLPNRYGLILSRETGISSYAIPASSFDSDHVSFVVQTVGSPSNYPSVGKHFPTPVGSVAWEEKPVDHAPSPNFEGVIAAWQDQLFLSKHLIDQYITTGYGQWIIRTNGDRLFRPTREIKRYWKSLFNKKIKLPADGDTREMLNNMASLERVSIRTGGAIREIGYMCGWCGVMANFMAWEKQKGVCFACGVHIVAPVNSLMWQTAELGARHWRDV